MNISVIEKLWNKTEVDSKTKCWLWKGGLFSNGYGSIWYNGTTWLIHKWSLCIYFKVPYNDKWHACHVDELCKNKNCWNPCHLYIGTAKENVRDSVRRRTQHNASKVMCPENHEYDIIDIEGARRCSICVNTLARKNRKLRKEK